MLKEAKKTKNYNPNFKYGVYQIREELNTSYKEKVGNTKKTVYDYVLLNSNLETLKKKLRQYYKTHIADKLFEHGLVK